jgi:dienelactone hydrolase
MTIEQSSEVHPWVKAETSLGRSRFVTQGSDANDVDDTLSAMHTVDDWIEGWSASGAVHESLAKKAEADGFTVTAGQAYIKASLSYHWGKMRWAGVLDNVSKYHYAHRRSIDTFELGAAMLDPTYQRLDIPYEDITIAAHIRRPQGIEKPPVVLLVPGMDSVKEEFWQWGNVFLKRGMAVLAFDGPGQGETRNSMPVRHDYETVGKAIIDFLEQRDDVNVVRIGAAGVSMGGYYAPRIACFEPRLKAVCSISGSYVVRVSPESPGRASEPWWQFIAWTDSAEESARVHGQRSLENVIGGMKCPYLVINGKLDAQSSYTNTEEIATEAKKAGVPVEYVLYEDGAHVCFNIPYKYRPLVGDWMAKNL